MHEHVLAASRLPVGFFGWDLELCSRVQPHEDEVDEYLKLDQLTDTNEW